MTVEQRRVGDGVDGARRRPTARSSTSTTPRASAATTHFAFRAVRFKNPTDSTLETGPVTVYGNERFIGEGLTEPIPPKRVGGRAVRARSPDRRSSSNDGTRTTGSSRLVTLQRGILTAEVQHIRRQKLTITNRLHADRRRSSSATPSTRAGRWSTRRPRSSGSAKRTCSRSSSSPARPSDVEIAEATPIERTLDLNADVTLDMMKVYVEAPEGTPRAQGPAAQAARAPQGARRSRAGAGQHASPARRLPRAHGRAARSDRHAAGGEDRRRPDDAPQDQDEGDLGPRAEDDDRDRRPGGEDHARRSSSRTRSPS